MADSTKSVYLVSIAKGKVKAAARILSGIDPVENPAKHKRAVANLNNAKLALKKQEDDISEYGLKESDS